MPGVLLRHGAQWSRAKEADWTDVQVGSRGLRKALESAAPRIPTEPTTAGLRTDAMSKQDWRTRTERPTGVRQKK